MPKHLDRDQIVTQTTNYEISLSEFDRWAEPLNENFARVLAENLSVLVPTDRVYVDPWSRSAPIDYQVTVDVSRFDVQPDKEVVMAARWSVVDPQTRRTVLSLKSTFEEAPASPPEQPKDAPPPKAEEDPT